MRVLAALLLMAGLGHAYANEAWPSFGSPANFTETSGEAIYGSVCASCHMPQGQGAVGAAAYPALAGDARLASPRYVVTRVLYGRGAMPGFGRYLSDDQVAAVVAYVQTRFGGVAGASADSASVASLR